MDSLTEMGILSTFQSQVEPSAFFCGRAKRREMRKVAIVYFEYRTATGEIWKVPRTSRVFEIDDSYVLEHIEDDEYWLYFEYSPDRARVKLLGDNG
jgi:hypothetical protein